MRVFSIIAGVVLALLSLVACAVSVIAIVDPVGTQMADDNDPFGPPPSRLFSLSMLGVSAAVGAAGVYLIAKSFPRR